MAASSALHSDAALKRAGSAYTAMAAIGVRRFQRSRWLLSGADHFATYSRDCKGPRLQMCGLGIAVSASGFGSSGVSFFCLVNRYVVSCCAVEACGSRQSI